MNKVIKSNPLILRQTLNIEVPLGDVNQITLKPIEEINPSSWSVKNYLQSKPFEPRSSKIFSSFDLKKEENKKKVKTKFNLPLRKITREKYEEEKEINNE